ncbi:hypothetical protein Hdeb2414_s0054g00755141 [Helianthus debilis subsp. tardiflorus]
MCVEIYIHKAYGLHFCVVSDELWYDSAPIGQMHPSALQMSTAVMNDTVMMHDPQMNKTVNSTELVLGKCDCSELTKECTPEYIKDIRATYNGNRMCGLCEEVVKDEMVRSERLIDTEEAMMRHMNFCQKSTSSDPPLSFAIDLIEAMRRFIWRGLDSPRALRSMPNSPLSIIKMATTEQCESIIKMTKVKLAPSTLAL